MFVVPGDIARQVDRISSSIRLSFEDGAYRDRLDTLAVREAYLKFESVRFLLSARYDRLRREAVEIDLEPFVSGLMSLVDDQDYMKLVDNIRYRSRLPRPDGPMSEIFHPALVSGRVTVGEAIYRLHESLVRFLHRGMASDIEGDIEIGTSVREATAQLRRLTPRDQNVAPVRFDVIDYRLIVVRQPATALPEDERNIAVAREELSSQGERILDQLERSNCDRRLLESFKGLQERLGANFDIVQLGLTNVACEIMCDKFQCELPDAVSAMMKAHTVGISMYVAQFPEWQRFTEQAMAAELALNDAPKLLDALDSVLARITDKPEVADPEVPKTLIAMRALISDPAKTTRRAVFAVWRTLENLVIRTYGYLADFLERSCDQAVKDGSKVAGKALVFALTTAALAAASAMLPVSGHLTQSTWLAKATEVVRTQVEQLAR